MLNRGVELASVMLSTIVAQSTGAEFSTVDLKERKFTLLWGLMRPGTCSGTSGVTVRDGVAGSGCQGGAVHACGSDR